MPMVTCHQMLFFCISIFFFSFFFLSEPMLAYVASVGDGTTKAGIICHSNKALRPCGFWERMGVWKGKKNVVRSIPLGKRICLTVQRYSFFFFFFWASNKKSKLPWTPQIFPPLKYKYKKNQINDNNIRRWQRPERMRQHCTSTWIKKPKAEFFTFP